MKKKTMQMIAMLCIELIVLLPVYTAAALQITHDPNPAVETADTSATIEWQTDVESTSRIDFGTTLQLGLEKIIMDYDTFHSITLENLTPQKRYYFQLMSIARDGDFSIDDNNGQFYSLITGVETDTTAPEISNVSIMSLTSTTATIRWYTDELSNSIVYFGEQGEGLNSTKAQTSMSTTHIITIPAEEDKAYDYVASSCDNDNNCANSTTMFLVGGADIKPPEIELNLPEWHHSGRIDIEGTTEPYTIVELYVNNNLARKLMPHQTSTGRFTLLNVALPEGQNDVRAVAIDQVGNEESKEYRVLIDPTPPTLIVTGVPDSPTLQQSASLTINISEPATIIFDVGVIDTVKPPKATGLKTRSVSANVVELEWDAINLSDFDEYAIYKRDRTSEVLELVRVGVTKETTYRDVKVQPGKAYYYRVSAVDKSCNEGEMSDMLDVNVSGAGAPAGEITLEHKNLSCETRIDSVSHDGGIFTHQVNFAEGINKIWITAVDRAGHRVIYKNETLFDSAPPQILTHNLLQLSPTYIPTVTVSGDVSEESSIIIYINEEVAATEMTAPDGSFSIPVELSRGSPVADDQRASISAAIGFDVGAQAGAAGPIWLNRIKLVPVDLAGSQGMPVEQDVVYTTCGYGSWFRVDIGGQPTSIYGSEGLSPAILNPRMMLEGMETISFPINLSYVGGYNASIMGEPTVSVYHIPESLRNEYDVDWATSLTVICDPRTRATCLVQINLNVPDPTPAGENWTMFEKEQSISDHRKGDCLIPGIGCIKVPMMLEINFKEIRPGTGTVQQQYYAGQPVVQSQIQKQCWDLEIAIDQRVPPDAIPEGLLQGAVGFLNLTINAIDAIYEPINTVKTYVFYACALMWVLQFVSSVSYRFACRSIGDYNGDQSSTPSAAGVLSQAAAAAIGGGMAGAFNADHAKIGVCEEEYKGKEDSLQNCKACEEAAKAKEQGEWRMKQLCDRIFCPSAPTLQKYIKDKAKTAPKEVKGTQGTYRLGSSCACQISTGAAATPATPATPAGPTSGGSTGPTGSATIDVTGAAAAPPTTSPTGTSTPGASASPCTPVSDSRRLNVGLNAVKKVYEWYEQEKAKGEESDCSGPHAADPKCCGIEYMREWGSSCGMPFSDEAMFNEIKKSLCLAGQNTNNPSEVEVSSTEGEGTTTVNCGGAFRNRGAGFCSASGNATPDIYNTGLIFKPGMTSALTPAISADDKGVYFSIEPPGQDAAEGSRNYKVQLCYITTRSTLVRDGTPSGSNFLSVQRDIGCYVKDNSWDVSGHFTEERMKKGERVAPAQFKTLLSTYALSGAQKADTVYQDILDKIGDPDREYIVDPTSSIWSAMRCLCLSAMTSYLRLYKSVFTSLMNCFNTILITGDGSAGVCQAVISRYVCDLLYEAIKCFTKKYNTGHSRKSAGGSFGDFFSALTSGGSDVSDSIGGRYGSSSMWRTMFVEKKLINSVCMWAFTGTWDIDFAAMLEGGEVDPVVHSIAFLTPCEMRYRSFNPTSSPSGITDWVYHFGVGIVAGADIRYNLKLQCTSGYDCDESDGFERGRCDCRSGDKEFPVTHSDLTGLLSRGSTLDTEIFFDVQGKEIRYNKAVLEYTWTDNNGNQVTNITECDVNLIGGNPPAFCNFDVGHGIFRCSLGFDTENWIKLNDVRVNYPAGQPAFKRNDKLEFTVDVQQSIPSNPDCANQDCEYTKYMTVEIFNHKGARIYPAEGRDVEAERLHTDGQSIFFSPPARIPRQLGDSDFTALPGAGAGTAPTSTMPCVRYAMPEGVSLKEGSCQPGGSCSSLCGERPLFTMSGRPNAADNVVIAIDQENYKVYIPKSLTKKSGVNEQNAGIGNNYYESIAELRPSTAITGNTVFSANRVTFTIVNRPQRYVEIVFGLSPPTTSPTSAAAGDQCKALNTFAKAKANPWKAEFKIWQAKEIGARYERSEQLEVYEGQEVKKTVQFYAVCSNKIEEAGVTVTRGCPKGVLIQEACWCSEASRQNAQDDPNGTPFDCERGKYCIDNECVDKQSSKITSIDFAEGIYARTPAVNYAKDLHFAGRTTYFLDSRTLYELKVEIPGPARDIKDFKIVVKSVEEVNPDKAEYSGTYALGNIDWKEGMNPAERAAPDGIYSASIPKLEEKTFYGIISLKAKPKGESDNKYAEISSVAIAVSEHAYFMIQDGSYTSESYCQDKTPYNAEVWYDSDGDRKSDYDKDTCMYADSTDDKQVYLYTHNSGTTDPHTATIDCSGSEYMIWPFCKVRFREEPEYDAAVNEKQKSSCYRFHNKFLVDAGLGFEVSRKNHSISVPGGGTLAWQFEWMYIDDGMYKDTIDEYKYGYVAIGDVRSRYSDRSAIVNKCDSFYS